MLAAAAPEPFDSEDYRFELKWDGIRCLAFVENGKVRLQSRHLTDFTAHFPELNDLRKLRSGTVLDGELVVMRAGKSSLSAIQERVQLQMTHRIQRLSRSAPAVYVAFDLLYLEYRSLLQEPFIRRRTALETVIRKAAPPNVAVVDCVHGQGKQFFAAVAGLALEGIVAKYIHAPYLPGRRSRNWLKIKRAI